MVDRIRYPTVSYLPFYYVFFQFLLLTIFNLQANILTTKDILSNLVYLKPPFGVGEQTQTNTRHSAALQRLLQGGERSVFCFLGTDCGSRDGAARRGAVWRVAVAGKQRTCRHVGPQWQFFVTWDTQTHT